MTQPVELQFIKKRAAHDLAEVEMGEMATMLANSNEVKDFGEKMIYEHSVSYETLIKLAQEKQLEVATEMDRKHMDLVKKLERLSSKEFDREYIAFKLKEHKDDISLAEQVVEQARDEQIKQLARESVLMLKKHLSLARDVQQKI